MKLNKLLITLSGLSLAVAGGSLLFLNSNKSVSAKATSIVLDDTTDFAAKENYGYRTKSTNPERAYGNMDLGDSNSMVYSDLQYSSSKSLRLIDKGSTSANSPLALLNCFGTVEEVCAGIPFSAINTKYIEFMIHFDGDPSDLSFSITDLETNATRLTSTVSSAPGRAYLSSTGNTEWYHFAIDLSKFGYNTGKSDANKVGAFRIQTPVASTTDYYIDQFRLVDAPTFDEAYATRKPFNDQTSMYEDDDMSRASTFYSGSGKYSFVESTTDVYGSSSRSVVITATKNNAAYSNFFADLWPSGVRLDKFGDDARLVMYINGSLTNTGFTDHATRFAATFSTSDHQKATGDATINIYFESFVEADNGWFYCDFNLKGLLDSAVSKGYALDSTTVYGLRLSCGNYQVVTGDYYVIDGLMVVGYKDAYDLISDVTSVDTCNSSNFETQGFVTRYNALNGYDKNMFNETVVDSYTLEYKLGYMCQYYGVVSPFSASLVSSNYISENTNLVTIVAIVSLISVSICTLLIIKKRKRN